MTGLDKSKDSSRKDKDKSLKDKEKEKDKDKDRSKSKDKKKKDNESEGPSPRIDLKPRLNAISSRGDEEFTEILTPIMRGKQCIHHGLKLTYFCDSCQEPVCNQCTEHGPHNNQVYPLYVSLY